MTRVEAGRQLGWQGKYTEALAAFEQAELLVERLSDDDLRRTVHLRTIDVLLRAGQTAEAQERLERLKANVQPHPDVTCAIGLLAASRGALADARASYEQALEQARDIQQVEAEGRAQGHLGETYLDDDNASFAVYLLREALDKLATSSDVALRAYFTGRLGEALIATGEQVAGQQYIGRALRLAEQLGDQRNEVRWRKTIIRLAIEAEQYVEARKHLMLALSSEDRFTADRDTILLLCRGSRVCLRLSEHDAALEYAQQAVALTADLNKQDPLFIAAQAALGIALRTDGDYEAAMPYLEFAAANYAYLEETLVDYGEVDVLRNLAAAQAQQQAFSKAAQTYTLALEKAAAAPLALAGTQRDIGILHVQQGELEKAIQNWSEALKIYEAEGRSGRAARLYCDIANLHKQLGHHKRAMKDYEQALVLLNTSDDLETRGIVLSNAATAYVDQGNIESAEAFFQEAISIAQELEDRTAEATRRGNYGWFLLATGRAERALNILNYALRQSENLGLTLQTAVQLDNIGLAYDALGQHEQALDYHQRALVLLEGMDLVPWSALVRANLGHTLVSLGRFTEAETHLAAALEQARSLSDTGIIVRSLTGRARWALRQERFSEAGRDLDEAVALAEYVHAQRLLAEALVLRSEQRMGAGQRTAAAEDWARAHDLHKLLRTVDHLPETPRWLSDTTVSEQSLTN
jgi:tetratricopeptide (TPR) repeat protein